MSNVPTNLIPTRITGLPEYTGDSTLGFMPYVLEGRTYKVQFSTIAAVGAVPSSRVIATGNGLEGGGDLSQNRTISIISHGVGYAQLSFTGVVAGTYGSADTVPSITVDETGRITSATSTPIVLSNYVPTSRTITAGAGLTGGGSLGSNITIALNPSNATPQSLGAASAGTGTQAARDDHVHPAVNLTDTSETQGVLPLGRGGTGVDLSPVVGAVIYADNDSLNQTTAGNAGQVLTSAGGSGAPYWQTITGTGTVTDVSVNTANGFAGTVTDPNTSAAITLSTTVSGMLKGDGTALSAASAGVDYVAPGAVTTSGLTMATSRMLGRTTAGTGAVEEITVGTGLSLSAGSLANSAPDQVVTLTGGGTTVITGTYPNFTITSNDQYSGTVTSVAASGGTTGLTFSGSPITTSGTLTLGGTLAVANGGTGATTAAGARTNLGAAASGANSDITSLSGITGAIGTPTYIQFDSGAGTTLAAGRLWYDQITGSLNMGMGGGNITQQIGEELFVYGKASAAITEGQVIVKTGAVGASGVITFAPAPLGTTDTQAIIGVATENIALNGFGRITAFGVVHGINTTGSAYGETWADGDTLYYNPNYVGGLTKFKPSAPNQKTEIGIVINAGSGGSGSIQVDIIHGTVLGGTDSNVQLTSPANLELLQYSSSLGYWHNVAATSISVGTAVTATNLAGGAGGSIPYQSIAGTTTFLAAGTGVLANNGGNPAYTMSPSLTQVTVAADPTTNLQVATKQYVDTLVASGITYHTPVKYEVPSISLNATYNNGSSGVGATLTNAGTLVAFTPDGTVASVGDRILVYNQTNPAENGVYAVTTVGSGSVAWVLTRATDADTYALKSPTGLGEGDAFFITSGATGAGETYVMNTVGTITFGTTAINFVQVSDIAIYSAGAGLTLTGTQFSLTSPVATTLGGTGLTSFTSGGAVYATSTSALTTGTLPLTAGGTGATTAAGARTSLGATTVGSNFFTLTNPSAITFPRINADNTVSALDAANFRTAIGAGTGFGSVTSVDVSGGTTGLTTSGGPITSSGTITLAGTLAVANGGTGATSLTSGYLLKGNGTSAVSASVVYDDGTNVGIGVVPSPWASTALQVGSYAALTQNSSLGAAELTSNSYRSTGSTWNYIVSDTAERYRQWNSTHAWFIAPSGTAGAAISFTQAMTLDANACLGIGTTPASAAYKLEVYGNSGNTPVIARIQTGASGNSFDYASTVIQTTGATGAITAWAPGSVRAGTVWLQTIGSYPIVFGTNDTENMRLTTGGSLLIGKTSVSGLGEVLGVNRTSDGNVAMIGRNGGSTNPYVRFIATDSGCVTTLDANGSAGTPALALSANSTEIMRLTSGNVGIGAAPSSSYRLDVNTASTTVGFRLYNGANTFTINGMGSGQISAVGYEAIVAFGNSFAGATSFITANTERARFDGSGNFLINTTTVVDRVTLTGGMALTWADDAKFWMNYSNDYRMGMRLNANDRSTTIFATTATAGDGGFIAFNIRGGAGSSATDYGTERMRVANSGYVGINTTTPAARLDVSGNVAQNVVAVAASAVDCATGNYFTKTAAGALTWTFTNVPASRSFIFALQLTNGGSGTQTWPAAVVWNGGSAPTLQASGTDILIFTTSDSGTTWRGVRAWKQA